MNRLGDTSVLLSRLVSYCMLTRRGKTRMYTVGIVFEFYTVPVLLLLCDNAAMKRCPAQKRKTKTTNSTYITIFVEDLRWGTLSMPCNFVQICRTTHRKYTTSPGVHDQIRGNRYFFCIGIAFLDKANTHWPDETQHL